ncbi:hypothetical protein CAI21_14350 [Alkalilimnicola ehrlichii]|uniref:Iron uptake protein n=1 Tax=Alkalilimnicola ehrlichii TaxID=351052 RepID=A0A3E0WNL4_9GAMM|nr:hypothetical protein [Alkalilimnicola ehrlichii]RFA27788.1 hypothetical protein CAI21_14350 [Alkalilimnicola ehrlichii]RFA33566.1 hypothetical protein CAL65_17075 [Alkalilimnicola ehrlichii]
MKGVSAGRHPLAVTQRLLLVVVGGYLLSAAAVALGGLLLTGVLAPSEAVALSAMLGFILYLVLLLWGFAERSLGRLWWLLGGGAVLGQVVVQALAWSGG